ncbi:9550_t:CDS:2, partial [Acaulospora morrowiae]
AEHIELLYLESLKVARSHILIQRMTLIPSYDTGKTDITRWRLKVDHGRQTWHYLEDEEEVRNWPQSVIEKYLLGLPFESKKFDFPIRASESARNGFEFFKQLQTEDGHWAGEYGGPMFLLPGLIIAMYVTKIPVPESWRLEIVRYLFNKAHPNDGGWGLHTEHHSTVFGTALNYVTLRILGVDADHPVMVKARGTLHKLGGAAGAPSWGKFWLASLNVYDWEGLNPIPPELWLFPYSLPIHPARFWIHTRVVYLPMGYIYGRRLRAELTPLIMDLRQELYIQPYESINWSDVALQESYDLIKCEDENTDYLDIAPVSKVMHILCTYYEEGPDSEAFLLAKEKLIDYVWMSSEGMMMNGTNGTQLWDTALMVLALIDTGNR